MTDSPTYAGTSTTTSADDASRSPDPEMTKPQILRPDTGGWISGSSITFDDVFAADVRAGDRLLLDDGMIAEVGQVTSGVSWAHGGDHRGGVAIKWQERGGDATGTLHAEPEDTLCRVRDTVGAPGLVGLDSDQAAIVLDALAAAAEAKGGQIATCHDCPQAEGGVCATCDRRMRAADGYEAVAEYIRGAS